MIAEQLQEEIARLEIEYEVNANRILEIARLEIEYANRSLELANRNLELANRSLSVLERRPISFLDRTATSDPIVCRRTRNPAKKTTKNIDLCKVELPDSIWNAPYIRPHCDEVVYPSIRRR